jgi:hypothetical protein
MKILNKIQAPIATQLYDGLLSAADKVKIDNGISGGGSNYVHPTGDGNLHVPATGTTSNNKVLKAGATAGSIAWGNVAFSELTGVPSTLAGYGVTDAVANTLSVKASSTTEKFTIDYNETEGSLDFVYYAS